MYILSLFYYGTTFQMVTTDERPFHRTFFFLLSLCLSTRSKIGTQRWLIYLSISSSSAATCKDIQPLFLYNRSAVRFIFKLCTLELGKIKMSRATKKETQIDNNADGHSGNASQSVSMSHFYKLDLQQVSLKSVEQFDCA